MGGMVGVRGVSERISDAMVVGFVVVLGLSEVSLGRVQRKSSNQAVTYCFIEHVYTCAARDAIDMSKLPELT